MLRFRGCFGAWGTELVSSELLKWMIVWESSGTHLLSKVVGDNYFPIRTTGRTTRKRLGFAVVPDHLDLSIEITTGVGIRSAPLIGHLSPCSVRDRRRATQDLACPWRDLLHVEDRRRRSREIDDRLGRLPEVVLEDDNEEGTTIALFDLERDSDHLPTGPDTCQP